LSPVLPAISVRVASTPGHTLGHLSVVLQTPSGEVLASGDAIFMHRALLEDRLPYALPGEHLVSRSLREITQYRMEIPEAVIIPGARPGGPAGSCRSTDAARQLAMHWLRDQAAPP
jgi:glyoxylase-like metal-dependent hydrolase (beta-lactamase superfamily II)